MATGVAGVSCSYWSPPLVSTWCSTRSAAGRTASPPGPAPGNRPRCRCRPGRRLLSVSPCSDSYQAADTQTAALVISDAPWWFPPRLTPEAAQLFVDVVFGRSAAVFLAAAVAPLSKRSLLLALSLRQTRLVSETSAARSFAAESSKDLC